MNSDSKESQGWRSDARTGQGSRLAVTVGALVLVVGLITTFTLGQWVGHRASDEPRLWSTGPTIEHVQSLNRLVTTKVFITDVLTGEGDGVRGVWLIKGDALLGIDMSDADVQILDWRKRLAVIDLSSPIVLSARVDHERSMTWDVQRTTWIPWKGDQDQLRDKAMYHAQKLVEFAAGQPELIEEAKRNASRAMSDIYRSVDWRIEIHWR